MTALNILNTIRIVDLKCSRPLPISELGPADVALGNFDGVHCAHRSLLCAAARHATDRNCKSAVFCFDPPSSDFLSPLPVSHLSTTQERLDLFAECGLDYAFLADFPALRHMSPRDFISRVLIDVCRAQAIVCGFNFRFGKGGQGNTALLAETFGEDSVDVIPPHCFHLIDKETVISSSVIRTILKDGGVDLAARLLGRPYQFCAPITYGKQLGHKIGSPTINQTPPPDKLLPAAGVYITRAYIDGAWIGGVSNIGVRPTVESDVLTNCETHLLNFDQEIYGKVVTIEFLKRLRDEMQFSSVEELRDAICRDITAARTYFNL